MVDTKYGRMKKIMPRHLDNDKPMKTHHADDETLEYIAPLEQKNARLRGALDEMIAMFSGTSESPGQDEAVDEARAALKDTQ